MSVRRKKGKGQGPQKPHFRAGSPGPGFGPKPSAKPWGLCSLSRTCAHEGDSLCLQPTALVHAVPLTCRQWDCSTLSNCGRTTAFQSLQEEQGEVAHCPSPLRRPRGNSRRHSLALSAVALRHGRSLKKGRHFSQSMPYVLCLQSHTSLSNSFFTHSLAWPLHLHLGREETLRKSKRHEVPGTVQSKDVKPPQNVPESTVPSC